MNDAYRNQSYSRLAIVAGVALFVVFTYLDSFSTMFELWQRNDHRHGILVLPIAAFLIWRIRNHLSVGVVAPDIRGIPIIAILATGWLVARLTSVQVVEHLMALALIPAAVFAFVGPAVTSRMLFPLLFLMLGTPISESLVPHLMQITADISATLLRASGFPVYRQGQYISLPGGEFVVADVCSGVRYLLAGIMIASLFAYLTFRTKRKRFAFVSIAAILLILANGFRAYVVMGVASASHMKYLGGADHIYFGWLLFGIVMILIMWFGMRFADAEIGIMSDADAEDKSKGRLFRPTLVGSLGLLMLAITLKSLEADIGNTALVLSIICVILAGVLMVGRQNSQIALVPADSVLSTVQSFAINTALIAMSVLTLVSAPLLLSHANGSVDTLEAIVFEPIVECGAPTEWGIPWSPKMDNPDFVANASYRCEGQRVNVFVAGYNHSARGKELVSSANNLSPPGSRRYSNANVIAVDPLASEIKIMETVVDRPGYQGIIWYWYVIDGRTTASATWAKVLQSIALLSRRPSGGMVVLLETQVSGDEDDARRALEMVAIHMSVTTRLAVEDTAE